MKYIHLILIAMLWTACSKDESCADHVAGIYSGNSITLGGVYPANLTVAKSSTGEFDFLITDDVLDMFPRTYSAKLSGDCTTLTVPSQIIMQLGSLATIYGIYQLNGDTLTGTLYITRDFFDSMNTYHLVKE